MKILQVNKFYHPDIGGVETVVKQYAEFLGRENEVSVLCVSKKRKLTASIDRVNNVNVIRTASFGTFFSMPISISFFLTFLKIYKSFDVIHFHEPFPLASLLSIFIRKKTKVIITWHSDIIKQKKLKGLVEFFQRKLCEKATLITTTSPNLFEFSSVISKYPKKVSILPLSINDKKSSSGCDKKYILSLGRLSYYKGIEVLLRAFELAKTNLDLLIVGDGDKKIISRINDFCSKSSKNVRFENRFVSKQEKEKFLMDCSFFVFPSVEPSEAFGIIQLEAMIFGKPVINTELPTGVPYVSLHNVTGITVRPNDPLQLAKAIEILSDDPILRKKLGTQANLRVKSKFSNQRVFQELTELYNNIL